MTKRIFLVGGIFLFLAFSTVSADNVLNENNFNINLDHATIQKGYTVTAFADRIKLSLVPGILASSTDVEVLNLSNEPIATSSEFEKISDIYQFEFKNKQAYDNHKPFYIQLSYDQSDNRRKGVFFFDKTVNIWRPLPTSDFPAENFVRSLIHLPYARIAVFAYPGTMTVGKTSWYSHKGGNFAASPDFPIGSKLRVKSLNSNKFVDVIVNDFGPDRKVHPERVIDLDKVAFQALAPLGAGVIDVSIEPLYIAPEGGKVLGVIVMEKVFDSKEVVKKTEVKVVPKIDLTEKINMNLRVKSAIAVNENTGNVIWEKDANSVLPLASLTKLVSMKVFLDTKPDLKKVVSYSRQDERYNQSYVDDGGAIAKLKVADGETMTIEDLLYSSLVGSANNAVESLVRVSGLDRDVFIDRMNKYVKSIGANSSYFIEPTGLAPQNVSSVQDYVVITKAVMKNATIKKVSTATSYEFFTKNTKKYHRLVNTNRLVTGNKYDITGSKTGYLVEAGYCLMSRVSYNGDSVIVVTFGAEDRSTSFYETEKLIKYSLINLNS
ncbi:serine hydrolase [Candidatus Parcubacteria bacterium]|nr:serine hydrolase [Patescibacteria group bacterium]MBU4309238.1 serine hydrolase [Patescibacteria group bacterium]MBU4432318.1 serine hydrolase [Patescibacteria group bacterium]MBU4577599.1 serine hydrolase [Patescibacteria group bacterium]MCG2697286.1 serine hydrolase [Candidatus Parcubacteria bacterium]